MAVTETDDDDDVVGNFLITVETSLVSMGPPWICVSLELSQKISWSLPSADLQSHWRNLRKIARPFLLRTFHGFGLCRISASDS